MRVHVLSKYYIAVLFHGTVIIASIIFWVCVVLMFHSYVAYPYILSLLARNKPRSYPRDSYQPPVIVLMAVYNAERVVEEKVRSVFNSNYPKDKIHFLVGSDCSSDRTNDLLHSLKTEFPQLIIQCFNERKGKIRIINELYDQALQLQLHDAVLVSTDATALFDKECISSLVKYFKDEKVAAVGANIIKGKMREDGISGQEKAYYERELLMKYEEGLVWGAAIGVFGACYAIRPKDYTRVPDHFLVDDFYISMCILENGRKILYDPDARVYMNLANESGVEYKRKVRIASGNFQNLLRFWKVLLRFNGLAFAFLSHKVLRWLGPFFILLCFICSILLFNYHWIYQLAFYTQAVLLAFPLINFVFEQLNFHQRYIKFIAHFYLMNLGILVGFFRYLGGIKTSVWEPTKR